MWVFQHYDQNIYLIGYYEPMNKNFVICYQMANHREVIRLVNYLNGGSGDYLDIAEPKESRIQK